MLKKKQKGTKLLLQMSNVGASWPQFHLLPSALTLGMKSPWRATLFLPCSEREPVLLPGCICGIKCTSTVPVRLPVVLLPQYKNTLDITYWLSTPSIPSKSFFFSRMRLGFLFLIDSLSSLEGLESSSRLLSHVERFPTSDPANSPSCLCLLPSPRDRKYYFEKMYRWEICSHNPLAAFPSPRDPNKAAPWNKHHSRLELCFLHPFPHRQYFGDLVNYIEGNYIGGLQFVH